MNSGIQQEVSRQQRSDDPSAELAPRVSRRGLWIGALVSPLLLGPLWVLLPPSLVPAQAGTLVGLVLLLMVSTCFVTDLKRHKIHNWATYTAFLWVVCLNTVGSWMAPGEGLGAFQFTEPLMVGPSYLGAVGLAHSLGAAAICFCGMLIAYQLAQGGAGDVKLAMVLGAGLGLRHGILAIALSYIAAATTIVVLTIWKQGPLTILTAFARKVGSLVVPMMVNPPSEDQKLLLEKPIPLAPFFALGTLLVLFDISIP